jgi:hypothetical protein
MKLIGADEQDQANKEAERGEAQGVEAQGPSKGSRRGGSRDSLHDKNRTVE